MDSDLDLELPSDVSSGDLPSDVSSVLVDNNSMEEDLSDQPSPTRVLNLDSSLDLDLPDEDDNLSMSSLGRQVSLPSEYEEMEDMGVEEPDESMLYSMPGPQDIAEYYSPPRVLDHAKQMGLQGCLSLDILTGWDFRKQDRRQLSIALLAAWQVFMLILSPPCTAFSQLQRMWNFKKMSAQRVEALWSSGMCFLEHSMLAAQEQVARSCFFAFEHPAGATSWSQDCVDSVRKLPGVFTVVFDQCMLD